MSSTTSYRELSFTTLCQSGRRLVLSVDDEPAILLTRERILEFAGYRVVSAKDGEQALQLFAEQPVELVLLDFKMPGVDGGIVAQRMKSSKPWVPILLVSASEVSDETLATVDCRIDKGHGPVPLLEKVAEYLNLVTST